jgi:hypothetical protein
VLVDVVTEVVIDRRPEVVAGYSAEPANAPSWYINIKSVEWKTPPPLKVGSRLAFVAQFLGRRLTYTYEVTDFIPGSRLVMATTEGPFPMQTTYTWETAGATSTRMTLRNRGKPRGFAWVFTPLMGFAMRRANRSDLARLKRILEGLRDVSAHSKKPPSDNC